MVACIHPIAAIQWVKDNVSSSQRDTTPGAPWLIKLQEKRTAFHYLL